jgi:hypothetical protein
LDNLQVLALLKATALVTREGKTIISTSEVLVVQSKLLITPVQEWVEVLLELYKTTKVQDS